MHEKPLRWYLLKPDYQEEFLVQITVLLTVELPATADLNVVEPRILDAGRKARPEALRLAALGAQAQVDHYIWHVDVTVGASAHRIRSTSRAP